MKVYAWLIALARFRENCPTGIIPEWKQKVTPHNGMIQYLWPKWGKWGKWRAWLSFLAVLIISRPTKFAAPRTASVRWWSSWWSSAATGVCWCPIGSWRRTPNHRPVRPRSDPLGYVVSMWGFFRTKICSKSGWFFSRRWLTQKPGLW